MSVTPPRTGMIGTALSWLMLCAAHPPVAFVPAAPDLAESADLYRQMWDSEGRAILATMEAVVGIDYPGSAIDVIVTRGRPMAAYDGRTIRLRAGYSPAYMKATLVHEFGHRLALTLPKPAELDDHRLLYLFLYDVWTDLYGQPFADRMVGIERRIGPDYAAAWDFALGLSREERQTMLRTLRGDEEPQGWKTGSA